jgi:hypothetical protein
MKPFGAKPFVGAWRDHRAKHWIHRAESDTPVTRARETRAALEDIRQQTDGRELWRINATNNGH